MKNIVLYRIAIVTCLLIATAGAFGQKPALDLLPSANHYNHPEAMVDTGLAIEQKAVTVPAERPTYSPPETILNSGSRKTERKKERSGFDTLFRKKGSVIGQSEKSFRTYPLIIKYINPVQFFLHITALK